MSEIKNRVEKFEGKGYTFTIPGVKLKWVKVLEPDRAFEPMFSVDMVLDENKAKEFKAVGFNVKQDKDGDWVLKAKRKLYTKAGKENTPPKSTVNGSPLDCPVGNGSVGDVEVWAKYYKNAAGKEFLLCYLNALHVTDLVEFSKSSEVPF